MKALIDRLYDMLNDIAAQPTSSAIWVVDCRGAMSELSDWNDEIHGNSRGFAKIADRFRATLRKALQET